MRSRRDARFGGGDGYSGGLIARDCYHTGRAGSIGTQPLQPCFL